MDKIQLPDGSLVSIEQAQSLFNDQYQTFIDDGTLKIVSEDQMSNNIFISPDGSEMTEKQARDLYKKQFQSFVNDGTLKKKRRYSFRWSRGSYGIHYRDGNNSWLFGFFRRTR